MMGRISAALNALGAAVDPARGDAPDTSHLLAHVRAS
jgi:hypothetical protein